MQSPTEQPVTPSSKQVGLVFELPPCDPSYVQAIMRCEAHAKRITELEGERNLLLKRVDELLNANSGEVGKRRALEESLAALRMLCGITTLIPVTRCWGIFAGNNSQPAAVGPDEDYAWDELAALTCKTKALLKTEGHWVARKLSFVFGWP